MSDFEMERIKNLRRAIIQDYNRHCQTKQFLNFETVEETDGTFIQVYFRTLVDRIWFRDPGHYPAFHALGGTIARGEVSYFLGRLKENVEVENVEEASFSPDWLKSVIVSLPYAYEYGKISLLTSIQKIYKKILTENEWTLIYNDVTKNFELRLNGFRIPIYGFDRKTIESDIVVLNKRCCRILYKLFHYTDLGIDSTISVEIEPFEEDNSKMDVLVRSIIKLDIYRREYAKIFSLS